jgi:hypothetical protein
MLTNFFRANFFESFFELISLYTSAQDSHLSENKYTDKMEKTDIVDKRSKNEEH